jgi:predicted methyltransferase
MNRIKRTLAVLLVATLAASPTLVLAQMGAPKEKSEVAKRIEAALASDIRTAEERARDKPERKPVETLEFFGLQPNMTVVELLPGAGWYTKILGQVLADNGKLILAVGADRLAPKLKEWKLDKVEVPTIKADFKPSGQYGVSSIETLEIPVQNADMVLTFRNEHNLTPESRARLHAAVLGMLKPGGIYGVVDHTGRHMAPGTRETWRRLDPVVVIQEITAAGFEFVGFSDLHYRPDDELRYDTERPSIAHYSDRFTLKFRKPLAK